ncbi:DEAD/DEAH box helicase family protein [Patescibacteria group bacterium]
MKKEAHARIKINNLLQDAGWRFFDDEIGKANIMLESNVKIGKIEIDALGEDFEHTKDGYIDFLLLDKKGFPYIILEAKSEDKEPLVGKEQARKYAISQNVRFIILSNGNLHYFWDLERGNPTIITNFPSPDSVKQMEGFKPDGDRLASEKVEDDYIVLTQKPNYAKDPRWQDEQDRESYIKENNLKFLRPYQLKAIHSIQQSIKDGKDRFLFEMATGTGKTLVSEGIMKLFLKTGNAKRVLFLVDRIELENQAYKAFTKDLKNDYTTVIYKQNRDDWRKAEIVITTVQSLSSNNNYQKLFSPTDFDFVISDEAHRSIGGNSRAVFEYFIGYKLGLTATPKDYLKKSNELNTQDIRSWERRQLLDTYNTFGCRSGDPTYRYSLLDGVKDGYLINPIVVDARTKITTDLLSEKGYSLMVQDEDGAEEEQTFYHKDFERKFFSDKTNKIFCKTFLENALKDPLSGEIGKTIIFCVSQNHATKITQILNEFAHELWPGKYNSDFALQVTSYIQDAQQFTINFANNNLNGNTRFLDNYKSSKTRVCVTVGMMTTGYDCQDILNLCLMRPIFSPTDFVQMKGRGTRKFTFSYVDENKTGNEETKENFKLFDFFANCEYFEKKFKYDEILKLPPKTGTGGPGDGTGGVNVDLITIIKPDPLKTLVESAIGKEGMKVDRKLFEKFEDEIKKDKMIKDAIANDDFNSAEDHIIKNIFEKPEEFFNMEKLRKALSVDRRVTLKEILEKIFKGSKIKSKNEILEEEFEKFVSIYKPDNKHVLPIKNFLKAYVTDGEIRDIVETEEYGRFATNPMISMADFKELGDYRQLIPEYVKDYITLNKYL